MRREECNNGAVKGGPEPDHWARYDALPTPFRRLLQNANVNYNTWWVEDFIAKFGEGKGLELARHFVYSKFRALVVEVYGRDHPQVRR